MSKMTGQTSATKKPTLEMLLALASFIAGVLAKLSFEQVQNLLKNKNTLLRKKLEDVFEVISNLADDYAEVRADWEGFYKKHFSIVVDFSGVTIPEKPADGKWRLIFVLEGLTMNCTLAVIRKLFNVWVYNEDLDAHVTTNTRTSAQKSYAVWVRSGDKPEVEYLGKSTRDADMEGKIGVTLLERLLLGFKYFTETKKHLDIKGVTFCTGSRAADGDVPGVDWFAEVGEVSVRWYDVGRASEACGLRQVVS